METCVTVWSCFWFFSWKQREAHCPLASNVITLQISLCTPPWVASEPKLWRRPHVSSSRSTTPSSLSTSTPTRGSSRRSPSYPPSLSATRYLASSSAVSSSNDDNNSYTNFVWLCDYKKNGQLKSSSDKIQLSLDYLITKLILWSVDGNVFVLKKYPDESYQYWWHDFVMTISDCRVHHSLDEETAAQHCERDLHQAPGGGAREKGQLRARRLRAGEG